MEIWFLSAVGGAILAGLSNFYFKQAAVRGYNAELFSLYGGMLSVVLVGAIVLLKQETLQGYGWLALLVFIGGLLAAQTNILKILALRFIDSTIYFPLYKLLAPSIAIVAGIVLFKESFTTIEWFGMALGISVPLLLITKSENSRQQNLLAGLTLVLITSITSVASAILNKYATDGAMTVLSILMFASLGIFIGTLITIVHKKGPRNLIELFKQHSSTGLIIGAILRAFLIVVSFGLTLYAYAAGGTLAIVQTIQSMYILIPIVLAIIFYNEHWSFQKVVAIVISVSALGLLQ